MYGLPWTTLDLDLVLEQRAQEDVVPHLEDEGYQTLHRSEGYSNHLHSDPTGGRIVLVYVGPTTTDELFRRAPEFPGPAGRRILVPRPEHLGAMKALAIKNDPSPTFQDLADVRFLLGLPGVDREEVRRQFVRYGLRERFDELENTL